MKRLKPKSCFCPVRKLQIYEPLPVIFILGLGSHRGLDMKIGSENFSQSALVLARSSLVLQIKDESLGFVTVASDFSVFLVEALSSMEHFKIIVIDGSCLNLLDFKTTRLNLLRALIKRHPEVKFLLFSDEDLCVYALSFSNLVVIEEKLSKEHLSLWVGIHSVS